MLFLCRAAAVRVTLLRPARTSAALLALAGLLAARAPAPVGAQTGTGRLVVTAVSPSGRGVEGATVTSGRAGALTDASGRAVLVLPAGPVSVRVERIGFARAEADALVRAGLETSLTVALQEQAVEAEGILVVSTRSERRIEDEPLRVEVVPREEVEEKLLMTPGDIAMLLNETAGLRVQPTSPSLGGASVRIQGMRGRYTLVLADGLPLHGGQTGALGPLQIPPMDLGQVEVIKGAASALYGASALGGVVNLISRRPDTARELLLNGTTLGGGDAVLWLADDPEGPWGWSLLAGAHGQGKADVDDDGWSDLPGFRRVLARPRLLWDDGRGRSVMATVGAMAEEREGGTVEGAMTPSGAVVSEEISTRRVDAGVLARAFDGGGRVWGVRGAVSAQRHRHAFSGEVERDRHVTGFAEASAAGHRGAHDWVAGAAVQAEAYHGRDVDGFDRTDVVPSLFAQDEVRLSSSVSLAASARADRHGTYGTFVSPRVSALVRLDPWTVRASAGGGWFAPSPFTEEVEAVGLRRLGPLPDSLRAERGRSASLDVGRRAGAWELNATLFASEVRDPVVAEERSGGELALTNAAEPARAWGAELLARWEAEPFHVTATYVHTRATELAPLSRGGVRREVPLTPRHTAGGVGAWEDEAWGRIGVELYYTGHQELDDDPYRRTSRPYVVMGFLIERRVGASARAFLNAENLLDARQTRWSPLVRPTRTPSGRWTTDAWAPLEGRMFNAGIRFSF
ncbi:MAG TPA: TonB-dependent receptor [Longimicrobiales bacterium]|nr:TonB-dependent receptor [Longimicrobiales bacterium]